MSSPNLPEYGTPADDSSGSGFRENGFPENGEAASERPASAELIHTEPNQTGPARDLGSGLSAIVRRPPFMTWVYMLLVVAGLAAFVEPNPLHPAFQGVDDWWRSLVGSSPADPFWQGPFPMFFQYVCDTIGAIIVCACIALLLLFARRWRHAIYACVALALGAGAVTQLLKNWIDRPRPAENVALDQWGPLIAADHGSFPSGHSAAAASLAVIVYVAIPPTWTLLRRIWPFIGVLFTLCTMWERALINAHWLSDTVAGACLGAGVSLLVWWLLNSWMEKDNERYYAAVLDRLTSPDASGPPQLR